MRELKKIIVATATLLICTAALFAQDTPTDETTPQRGIATYQTRVVMAADSTAEVGYAAFREDSSSMSAISTYEAQRKMAEIDGYRVGVYFDNSAQARSGALAVVQRCDSLLSDIPSTMSYDNPYFKVSVGYCTTEEEAVIMLNRVQRYFPKAYLMRERITAEEIIAAREQEVASRQAEE